jgi:hypothetical protein
METKRKMAFYEVHKGKLALDTQSAFEEAQQQAFIHNSPAKVILEINVYPPADRNNNFGGIQYAVRKSLPSTKSMKLTTQLTNEGIITQDGDSKIAVLQEELQFDYPQVYELKKVEDK